MSGVRIAIVGKQRSGKDTVAGMLAEMLPGTTQVVKLAGPIYRAAAAVRQSLGLPPHEKDRLLLQVLGTEYGRAVDPNFWIDRFRADVAKLDPASNLICTDCRFINEAEALKADGWTLVYVARREADRIGCEGFSNPGHASEAEIDQIRTEHLVANMDTLDGLRWRVKNMLEDMSRGYK